MNRVKFICLVMVLSMLFGVPCMAADAYHQQTTIPEEIEVEGLNW